MTTKSRSTAPSKGDAPPKPKSQPPPKHVTTTSLNRPITGIPARALKDLQVAVASGAFPRSATIRRSGLRRDKYGNLDLDAPMRVLDSELDSDGEVDIAPHRKRRHTEIPSSDIDVPWTRGRTLGNRRDLDPLEEEEEEIRAHQKAMEEDMEVDAGGYGGCWSPKHNNNQEGLPEGSHTGGDGVGSDPNRTWNDGPDGGGNGWGYHGDEWAAPPEPGNGGLWDDYLDQEGDGADEASLHPELKKIVAEQQSLHIARNNASAPKSLLTLRRDRASQASQKKPSQQASQERRPPMPGVGSRMGPARGPTPPRNSQPAKHIHRSVIQTHGGSVAPPPSRRQSPPRVQRPSPPPHRRRNQPTSSPPPPRHRSPSPAPRRQRTPLPATRRRETRRLPSPSSHSRDRSGSPRRRKTRHLQSLEPVSPARPSKRRRTSSKGKHREEQQPAEPEEGSDEDTSSSADQDEVEAQQLILLNRSIKQFGPVINSIMKGVYALSQAWAAGEDPYAGEAEIGASVADTWNDVVNATPYRLKEKEKPLLLPEYLKLVSFLGITMA